MDHITWFCTVRSTYAKLIKRIAINSASLSYLDKQYLLRNYQAFLLGFFL